MYEIASCIGFRSTLDTKTRLLGTIFTVSFLLFYGILNNSDLDFRFEIVYRYFLAILRLNGRYPLDITLYFNASDF